jgi:hypothetical protein
MRINYAWIMLRRKTFHAANADTAMQTKFVAACGTRGLSQKLADDLAASNCRLANMSLVKPETDGVERVNINPFRKTRFIT